MANTVIQLKHSTLTGNVPSSLANGEISINSRDGKFFYSTPAGVVTTHYPYLGPAGLNKEIQFNDGGTLGSNAGLAFDKTSGSLNVSTTLNVSGRDLGAYANAAFLQANTPSNVSNSAATYANSAFLRANTPSDVANSAATYANGAFTRANNSINANTGGTITGNLTISGNLTMTGAGNISVANISITNNLSAITAALTVNSITTGTGTGGTIAGANTIYANTFIANTGGYIQFADGSKQYTANAGSGTDTSAGTYANAGFAVANSSASYANAAFAQANTGSGAASAGSYANSAFSKANSACTAAATAQSTASSAAGAASAAQATADAAYNTNDFALIYTPNNTTTITASARRDTFNIVGESGVVAYANSSTKTITIAGTPGAQGLTVDYGYVADPLYYAIDYGTL